MSTNTIYRPGQALSYGPDLAQSLALSHRPDFVRSLASSLSTCDPRPHQATTLHMFRLAHACNDPREAYPDLEAIRNRARASITGCTTSDCEMTLEQDVGISEFETCISVRDHFPVSGTTHDRHQELRRCRVSEYIFQKLLWHSERARCSLVPPLHRLAYLKASTT